MLAYARLTLELSCAPLSLLCNTTLWVRKRAHHSFIYNLLKIIIDLKILSLACSTENVQQLTAIDPNPPQRSFAILPWEIFMWEKRHALRTACVCHDNWFHWFCSCIFLRRLSSFMPQLLSQLFCECLQRADRNIFVRESKSLSDYSEKPSPALRILQSDSRQVSLLIKIWVKNRSALNQTAYVAS